MRILHIAHRFPYPPNKGDKIRTYNIVRHFARRHDVDLVTLVDDVSDLQHVETLRSELNSLHYARIDGFARKAWSARRWPFGGSITTAHFHESKLQRTLDELVRRNSYELVFCSSSPTAEYLFRSRHWSGRLRRVAKIMDLIDVDSLKWQQYAERSTVPRRWIYQHEARHLGLYERRIYDAFDRLLLVSEKEREYFPGGDQDGKILAVPNGVDLDFFQPRPSMNSTNEQPTLVFTGMMDYWPNIEGVNWFLQKVLPQIRKEIPATRIFVAGGRPAPEVLAWGQHENVTVTGFVDDIRQYISSADVFVAPLRIARGVQNKVLEAMAMGRPIVTTSQAMEGVNGEPDLHALVADDAADFAAAVVGLLRNRAAAEEMGRKARRFVEEEYDWERGLAEIDESIAMLRSQ